MIRKRDQVVSDQEPFVLDHGRPMGSALGMAQFELDLQFRGKFLVHNLYLDGQSRPSSMTFPFEGAEVRVELPSSASLKYDFHEKQPAWIVEREEHDEHVVAKTVLVREVEYVVDHKRRVTVDTEQVKNRRVHVGLDDDNADELRELTETWRAHAIAAFEVWLQMFRFQTGDWILGRPPIESSSGSTRAALETRAGDAVSVGYPPSISRWTTIYDAKPWHRVEAALQAGERAPLHHVLYLDAMYHLDLGDARRAIIDAAVAAEIYIKSWFRDGVLSQANLPRGLRKHLEGMRVEELRKFFKTALTEPDQKKFDELKVQALFEARNRSLHHGAVDLELDAASKLVEGVRELFELKPSSQ